MIDPDWEELLAAVNEAIQQRREMQEVMNLAFDTHTVTSAKAKAYIEAVLAVGDAEMAAQEYRRQA